MRGSSKSPVAFHCAKCQKKQAGATMVEVLVALLVISLGLLGIGGLSAATFGYNKAAQLRLTGLSLVNDYADRARLNVYGFDSGNYTIKLTDAAPSDSALATAKDEMKVSATDPLSAAQKVAAYDRQLFLRTVASRLPRGRAVVATNPTDNARNLDMWLLWQEPTTKTGDSLFETGQSNCPSSLTSDEKSIYSCMYFKAAL